ncbi:MAG: hypothetical protein GX345_01095 [Clostridiales bacterium]|nr:hypothetical protein [Clostridiales bacterium]
MKQVKPLLIFALTFIILFAACAKPSTQGVDSSQSSNPALSESAQVTQAPESATPGSDEVTETPESTTLKAEKALISVAYMTDELLEKYDSFHEFTEGQDENSQKIIFTTNLAVKDFSFIEVAYEDKGTDFTFFENRVLYSMEELSPTKPLAVTWMEQGTIPHRGISYIDENGKTRYFYITMSGEDGSLLLLEFMNES